MKTRPNAMTALRLLNSFAWLAGFAWHAGFSGPVQAAAPASDSPASAARGSAGEAGHYEVTEFVDRSTLIGDGRLKKRIEVPQASCYPACRPEQVDSHLYRVEDPSGDELVHPLLRNDDAIDPVHMSLATLQQIDATTLQLAVRTRDRARVWYVEADKLRRTVTSQKETTTYGKLACNDPFFVVFNHAALPTLVITMAGSTVELGPSELDLNQLPRWLVESVAPQQLGASTVYTLKVVGGPGCAASN